MIKWWNRLSISYKISIMMLLFILIIELITIFYIWYFESKVLIEKERQNLTRQLNIQAKQLDNHFAFLAKETRFLASLEVMDDIIAKDLDKRINILIQRRAEDLGENIIILIMNHDSFITSSQNGFIKKKLKDIKQKLDKNFLYFYAPVYSSFEKHSHIGMVVMLYPLKNLTSLSTNNPNKHLWISPPQKLPDFNKPSLKPSIIVSQELSGTLKGWTLHLAYAKQEALLTVKNIETTLFYTFLLAILFLIVVVWILSKKLTKPITTLSKTFQEIIQTKDYSKQVYPNSQDEIGELTVAFNSMIIKTKELLNQLKAQNKIHQDQLIELMGFFNALIKTTTKQETIETALSRIESFSGAKEAHFIKHSISSNSKLPIKMYDYKNKEVKILGSIEFLGLHERKFNANFFNALSKMIKLQLEHISLLQGTKEALEAKSIFLSTISHELRTPLGAILNLTQHLMISANIKEEESAMLRSIEISAEHLLSMINNILQLSKLESNAISVHKENIILNDILEEIFEIVTPLIDSKNLIFQKIITNDKIKISTDINLFKQVVINLLSNAIKFTDKGKITLKLIQHKNSFELFIIDTGIGIDPKNQKYLFESFFQAQTNLKNLKSSSGLGLALSQKVAHLLGGKIKISSQGVGKGTTATFTF